MNGFIIKKTLRCHGIGLSFLTKPVVPALIRNPHHKLEVGRIIVWHETGAKMCSEFPQLFQPCVPRNIMLLPFEFSTLELSNALCCHGAWLSFLVKPVVSALLRNPHSELGVGSILDWHAAVAVAELNLEFAQLLKSCAPNGCPISLCWSPNVQVVLALMLFLYR